MLQSPASCLKLASIPSIQLLEGLSACCYLTNANWRCKLALTIDTFSCFSALVRVRKRDLTKIVQPMRMRAQLIVFQDELEVMGRLVNDHSRVFPTSMDDLAQAIPRMLFHKKLRGYIFHLHHFCAVWKVVYCSHLDSCKTAHEHTPKSVSYSLSSQKYSLDLLVTLSYPPFPTSFVFVFKFQPFYSIH